MSIFDVKVGIFQISNEISEAENNAKKDAKVQFQALTKVPTSPSEMASNPKSNCTDAANPRLKKTFKDSNVREDLE